MRYLGLVSVVLLGLALVARAEEKVQKDQGSARARFAWDKWDGKFADEQSSLARIVEGSGTGAVEIDSTNAAIWVTFDASRTSATTILDKLRGASRYEAAKITSVVAFFDAPFGSVHANARIHPGKSAKPKGDVSVSIDAAEGHTLIVSDPHKRGRFQPGITLKAPSEVELERGAGHFASSGRAQSYKHGFTAKKGAEGAVITVTLNVVDKGKDGKETLHAIELDVPVQAP